MQYVQTSEQLVVQVNALQGVTDTVTVSARLLLPVAPQPGQPDGSGRPAQPGAVLTAAQLAAQAAAGGGAAAPHVAAQPAYIQQLQLTVPVTGGTPATVKLPLQEGYLLSVAASSATATGRGSTFVRCWLQQRGATGASIAPAMVLFADYTTQTAPIGWPPGRVLYPTEGTGLALELNPSNPSAGTDWSYQVPTSTRMRIESIGAKLVTSSTAGARVVHVYVLSGGGRGAWSCAVQQSIPASTTAQFSAAPGQFSSVVDTVSINGPLPSPMILTSSSTIGVSTSNIQAGDQWSNIVLLTEQWIDML
jgi:hypothetical protein